MLKKSGFLNAKLILLVINFYKHIFRSSRLRMFFKISALKNFAIPRINNFAIPKRVHIVCKFSKLIFLKVTNKLISFPATFTFVLLLVAYRTMNKGDVE